MLADLSDRTKLKLTGPDRVRYLNGQITNDVSALGPDEASRSCYACVTNAKGKLEADIHVTDLGPGEDAFLIDAAPELREEVAARLEKYIIADDVELTDVTKEYALLHLLEGPDESGSSPPAGDFEIISSRSNRFGPPGLDFLVPATQRDALLESLGLPLHSAADLEFLRIAHGVPRWGAELTPDILPPEAGLQDRAISYTKGCYIGQEIISRLKSVGRVNRELVALTADDADSPFSLKPGQPLFSTGDPDRKKIGTLTSITTDARLPAPAALGYLKRDFIAPGTTVFAGNEGDPIVLPLTVRKTPLI